MPGKAKPNAFYVYMKEKQSKYKKEGRHYSMEQMPAICREQWQSLSSEQKAPYERRAKADKAQQGAAGGDDWRRKDNQRQIIAERRDPVKEDEKRRILETKQMRGDWKGHDLKNKKFHVISFQLMFSDWNQDYRLPMEIGMVSLSMQRGLIDEMHRFIHPGDPPEGYRAKAMEHSDGVHQIPLDFDLADSDFKGLWRQMEEFVGMDEDNVPPIFCLSFEREEIQMCLEYIHNAAHIHMPNRFKVYCLEDLVSSLIVLSTKGPEPSLSQILDFMQVNTWDYNSEIKCEYHRDKDCANCSISIAKRLSFAMFDLLKKSMDFTLTKNHLPDETDFSGTVVYPGARGGQNSGVMPATKGFGKISNGGGRRPEPSQPLRSTQPAQHVRSFVETPIPIVSRTIISLDQEEEDSEDDDPLYTEEVRSTVEHYAMRELRLPTSMSIAAAPVAPEPRQPVDQPPQRPAGGVDAVRFKAAMTIGRGRGPATTSSSLSGVLMPPPGFSASAPAPTAWAAPSAAASPWGPMPGAPEGLANRTAPASLTPASLSTRTAPVSLFGGPQQPGAFGRGEMFGRGRATPGGEAPMVGYGRGRGIGRGYQAT